ncbi:MAG: cytochrome C [Ignavibacteria bacterium CG1_02_37_35]|nr:MAG: cytochrome C [Ignavibacteria bacterium CG1_02_37_35]
MMKKNFISPLVLLIILTASVSAQISPGKLVQAHQNLEGLSNCSKCHELGDKVLNSKCLACHKEINTLIKANRGYHASTDVRGKECFKCHSDHNGRTFEIIRFSQKSFDHQKTTFNLEGKHKELKCDDCHQTKFISDKKSFALRKNTFLGLSNYCKSCHADVHLGALGSQCSNCHSTEGFKPAKSFDHNKTAYQLNGKHSEVKCDKCHKIEKRNGKDFQKFKGIQFTSCENCHNDIHQGKFGKDCQKCHVTTGFGQIKSGQFDHNKTNYKLIGKHIEVKCNSCHGSNVTAKLKHTLCLDCHKDYHKGSFVKEGKIKDCTECHTEKGFTPSLFTIETHNQNKFQLIGSHLAVPCKTCHFKEVEKEWHFVQLGQRCNDCHKNIHGDEIKAKFIGNNECSNCHNTETWQKINFDHEKTEFRLLGKHGTAACSTCHEKKKNNEEITIKFASVTTLCEGCHRDVHVAQFKVADKNDCERCHTFDNWKPVKFDHEKTKFPLAGGHQAVACNACHKKVIDGSVTFIKFKLEEFKCVDCHK